MDNNKKNLIIAAIGLVFGIGFVINGIINLKQISDTKKPNNEPPAENNNNNSEETLKESDVETWLNGNTEAIDYMINYGEIFDSETATEKDYSNVLAWYILKGTKATKETSENKDYDYDLVLKKDDALTFMQNTFNKTLDVVNFDEVTISKENLNFLTEEDNYRLQVKETEFTPNNKSILDNINIDTNTTALVTYGMMDVAATCEPVTKDCYTKYRKLTLTKTENGFNIVKIVDEEIKEEEEEETNN